VSEPTGNSNKHLLIDAAVILESWSHDNQEESALSRLLEATQAQGARIWVSALDVCALQLYRHRRALSGILVPSTSLRRYGTRSF
jgi:hypothetical protein